MRNDRAMYSVHPSVSYVASILVNLSSRTGRSLDEWKALVRREAPADDSTWNGWLREVHGLGGTTAHLVTSAVKGDSPESYDADRYLDMAVSHIETMFSEKKVGLIPVYEKLVGFVLAIGDDIRLSPVKTFVPVYRNHVIAQIKPSTRTRIDLGLALKGLAESIPARLIDTGGLQKGDRITHRIPIMSMDEVDSEVDRWLRVAYELDG